MIDVLTVQEIELETATRAGDLEAMFQARYNAPLIQAALVQAVLDDPAQADQLKQTDPPMYERVMKQIARMQAILKGA